MARAVEREIERLRTEVSIEALAQARGVVLGRDGDEMVGRCPFHRDEATSLVVDPAANTWRCRGACATGGSVIEWVSRAEGVSERHAVELLRAGLSPTGEGPAPQRASIRKLAVPLDRRAEGAELLAQVVGFYAQTLKESPEALAWLEARGLRDPEILDHFRLGYANRTLGYRLPERNRKEGAELRGRLQALGILRASGHEHFRGALVVPIIDEAGTVAQLYGRRLGRVREERNANTAAHLWLPGERRGTWNPEALAASHEIILTASLTDALTFWCAGFRHVTAAWGPDGFSADHAEAFRRHGVTRVLIAFGRPGGDRAAAALAERLGAGGVECFRVTFPRGADANDVALGAASATDTLGRMLRAATWMGAGPGPKRRPSAEPARPEPKPEPARAPSRPGTPSPVAPATAAPPAAAPVAVVDPAVVSPLPAPAAEPEVELVDGELRVRLGERRWRVRGLERLASFDQLRLNVLVARVDEALGELFHVDTLDLYSARARAAFVHAAAGEVRVGEDVVRRDLGRVVLACEERATEAVRAAQAPRPTAVTLSDADEAAALELLRDTNLVERIVADVGRSGVVGEATNVVVGYLAAVSRKLDTPLAVLVQSMSAAGKSSLMEAVLAFVPPEDRVKFSAMTGQSLFYMGEADLAHKVLAVVEEEGATRASYALKLLQSEGELSIASTGKDSASGRLTTQTYRVAGPVALFLTTTAAEVDEELANRCMVLAVDEDRAQTRAIHDVQRARQTLDGLLAAADRRRIVKLHQDAQRLLAPMLVANPYAPQLGFADERTRTRRDHLKYLTLIRAIALLHQHQRPWHTVTHMGEELTYIEVTPGDIALANRLAHEVLGRSLDELAPQTRRLLELSDELVGERVVTGGVERRDVRFTRREMRAFCGWSDFQVRVHLGRLVELEYVLVHRGGRGQSFVYELLYDGGGVDGRPHLVGLTDPATLAPCGYDADLAPGAGRSEGSSSGHRAPSEGRSWPGGNGQGPAMIHPLDDVGSGEHATGANGVGAIAAGGG